MKGFSCKILWYGLAHYWMLSGFHCNRTLLNGTYNNIRVNFTFQVRKDARDMKFMKGKGWSGVTRWAPLKGEGDRCKECMGLKALEIFVRFAWKGQWPSKSSTNIVNNIPRSFGFSFLPPNAALPQLCFADNDYVEIKSCKPHELYAYGKQPLLESSYFVSASVNKKVSNISSYLPPLYS